MVLAKRRGENKTGIARTVKDIPAQEFIAALAAYFKNSNKIELPEWHDLVKTSVAKEMGPLNPDWYYVRAASLARKVYLRGGMGVGAFTRIYGSRQRRLTYGRFHFRRASKGIIRHILIQLAEQGYIDRKKDKKGRWITSEGRKMLDTVAGQVKLGVRGDNLPIFGVGGVVSAPVTETPPVVVTKPTPGATKKAPEPEPEPEAEVEAEDPEAEAEVEVEEAEE